MSKLLPFLVLISTACLADVVVRNGGSRLGPVTTLNTEKDGGLTVLRDAGMGVFTCNPANEVEKGCIIPGDQAFGAGAKTFNGVVSAPVFDGGFAYLTDAVSAKQAFIIDTTDPTAALISGTGLDAGALVAISSSASNYAFQTGRAGSFTCVGCCASHTCGPTIVAGARTLTIDGAGDLVTTGTIAASSTATLGGALVLSSYVNGLLSPGNATVNKVCGRNAIASGALSATITNSFVTTGARVFVAPGATDTDCLYPRAVVVSTGSFVFTMGPSVCAADLPFAWCVVE